MTRSRITPIIFSVSVVVGIALVGFVSCDNARSDLFEHARDDNSSGWIGVYPEPAASPEPSAIQVRVSVSEQYAGWKVFYALDSSNRPPEELSWNAYDDAKGIIISRNNLLSVCAYDDEGIASPVRSWYYAIAIIGNPVVYVSSDPGPGGDGLTATTPLKTIQAGIDLAAEIAATNGGVVDVRVRTGDYHESIVTRPGIRLIGSYDATFTTGGMYPPYSRIYGTAATSSVGTNPPYDSIPSYGLRVPASGSAPAETYVESFSIRAPAITNVGAGALIEGQNARFVYCDFWGNGLEMQAGYWVRPGGNARIENSVAAGNDVAGLGRMTAGAVVIDGALYSVNSSYNAGMLQGGLGIGLTYFGLFSAQTTGSASVIMDAGNVGNGSAVEAKVNAGIGIMGGTFEIMNCPFVNSGQNNYMGGPAASYGILLDDGPTGARTTANIHNNAEILGANAGNYTDHVSAGIAIGNNVDAVIRNNSSILGDIGFLSAGVVFRGSGGSMTVADNGVIRGADWMSSTNVGAFISVQGGLSAPIVVARNRIRGGSGNSSAGVSVEIDADPVRPIVIRDNAIHGGAGSYAAGVSTSGLVAATPAETVYFINNDIISTNLSTYGAYVRNLVRPVFINNIVYGQHIGLYVLESASAMPREMRNNAFSDQDDEHWVVLDDMYTPIIPTGTALNSMAGCSMNMNVYPGTAFQGGELPNQTDFDSFNFALDGGADPFFREDGMDCSGYFPDPALNDIIVWTPLFGAVQRSVPWSVGAAEY